MHLFHNRVRNENGMRLMIKKMAESVKQDLSYTKIQNIITGIGYKTSKGIVIDYCGYCIDAFLLFLIENYYASFLDKNSNPKYYFMDNGILNLSLAIGAARCWRTSWLCIYIGAIRNPYIT